MIRDNPVHPSHPRAIFTKLRNVNLRPGEQHYFRFFARFRLFEVCRLMFVVAAPLPALPIARRSQL
jgi:hypothetical protein